MRIHWRSAVYFRSGHPGLCYIKITRELIQSTGHWEVTNEMYIDAIFMLRFMYSSILTASTNCEEL